MAKPYQEGSNWSFRLRVRGQDIYRHGYPSEAAAKKAEEEIRAGIEKAGQAKGDGPFRTSLARAFLCYGRERLKYLKGGDKDANRINRYLRPMGLPTLSLKSCSAHDGRSKVYWEVSTVEPSDGRVIPNSLLAHRKRQEASSAASEQQRARLAGMKMADITTYEVQQLIDAMVDEGKGAATVGLEIAELRRLFNYARKNWHWSHPAQNPVSDANCPTIDNARKRVLTNEEWGEMSKALAKYGNPHVAPLVCLMLETAMRSCEPLTYARWQHVNWTRGVLELPDAKGGKRDVPLGPGAMNILENLAKRAGTHTPDAPIFPTTYEAVKKAWAVCREACGFKNLHIHDLRHTAATRYSLEFKGDLPVIMGITGHKTVSMVMRYINLKADDIVCKMHGQEPDVAKSAAGFKRSAADVLLSHQEEIEAAAKMQAENKKASARRLPLNVVRVDFGRRAA